MALEQLNRLELKGYVGHARITQTSKGRMCRFSVATNHFIPKSPSKDAHEETTWHNVRVWEGRIIKNLEEIQKGCYVYVVGRVRYETYKGQDGVERLSYEVIPTTVEVLDPHTDVPLPSVYDMPDYMSM